MGTWAWDMDKDNIDVEGAASIMQIPRQVPNRAADRTMSKTTAAATGKTKGEVEIGRPESHKMYRSVPVQHADESKEVWWLLAKVGRVDLRREGGVV